MANQEEVLKRLREEVLKLMGESAGWASGGSDDVVGKKPKRENEVGTGVVVRLGTQEFTTSRQMFENFRGWLIRSFHSGLPMDHSCVTMLADLVKQGHPEPDKLIGCGVHSFQVRRKMMCGQFLTFVIVRKDGSKAEFCFKICVNNILPLPDDLKSGGAVCECLIEGGMSGPDVSYLQRLEQEQNRLDDDESLHVYLGPMRFRTFLRMYGFFYTLLLESPLNESLVKENVHEMLLDLLNKGDPELGKKIGNVESFQVRIHPGYGGILRSFYFVRGDGSMEDFCFIKCIDGIFPLSEKANKSLVGPCSCHHEEDGEGVVTLGCKKFRSSNRMLSYVTGFSEELRDGYQIARTAVLAFLKKGDPDWEKKMGGSGGDIKSIQKKLHPNRELSALGHILFVVVRSDGSEEFFCSWTCMNNLPLPPPLPRVESCKGGGAKDGSGGGSRRRAKGGAGGGSRRRANGDAGGGSRRRANGDAGGGSHRRSPRLHSLV